MYNNYQNPYKKNQMFAPPSGGSPPSITPPHLNSPSVNRVGAASNPNNVITPPKPMTFDANQTQGLMAALARQSGGTATADDTRNLAYAQQRGFNPQSGATQPPVPQTPAQPVSGANQAPTPQAPFNAPNPQIEALRKSYMESMGQSEQERKLSQELQRLQDSYRQGNQQVQDQVIPMEFITGQQQSLENRFNNSQRTLTEQLALLQNERAMRTGQAETALRFGREDQDFERSQTSPQQFGEEMIRLNPATGQYERVYGNPNQTPTQQLDKQMLMSGYSYVRTPAERDELRKQGYEIITTPDGRTYAKPGPTVSVGSKSTLVNRFTGEPIAQGAGSVGGGSRSSGGSSGGGSPKLTPEEKAFETLLNKQRDHLAKGGSWGVAWDTIKNRYPSISNKDLDMMLNKDKYYTQTGQSSKNNTKTP